MSDEQRLALIASPTPQAQEAANALRTRYEWVPIEQAVSPLTPLLARLLLRWMVQPRPHPTFEEHLQPPAPSSSLPPVPACAAAPRAREVTGA